MRRSASSGIDVAHDTGLARQAGALRRLDDQAREALAPPPVEAVGLRVFVDQPLELARLAGQARRRRAAAADGRWSPPAMRRLACAASPGLLTMNG